MNRMNIIEFAKQLEDRMKDRLDQIKEYQGEIFEIGHQLTIVRESFYELRDFANIYKFADESEEIRFFKEVKPAFLSQYIYHKKLFTLRLFDLFQDLDSRRKNYRKELRRLERFMRNNLDFYKYCMTGANHLDGYYFTRGKSRKSVSRDTLFSTGFDKKLARILANELMRKYISGRYDAFQRNQAHTTSSELKWTGSKTDLVELIYALYCAEAFNSGSANIKLISSSFASVFNVDLGDYYRTFQDVRIRKRRQTPFLDKLRETLTTKLDNSG